MSGRTHRARVALIALASLPYWMTGIYYVNVASQILLYAVFALGLNVLVGYAGLVSLGHAGLFGIACYAAAYLVAGGYGHIVAIIGALVVGLVGTAVFAALSLRASGIGFIMITLALGEILWGLAYRWISITNGDNGISVASRPAPFGLSLASAERVLLRLARGVPARGRDLRDLRALAVRRGAARHARSAAAHERARLSCLDDPVLGLHVFRLAGLRRRHPVRLLQPVHQPAGGGADRLRGGAADGDLGGAGTLLGPIVGAALVVIVKNVVSGYIERWNFMLGAIFVAIVIFMPEGLVPGTARLSRTAWRALSRQKAGAAAMAEAKP